MSMQWAKFAALLILSSFLLACGAGDTGVDPFADTDHDGLVNSVEDLNEDGVYDEDSDGDGIPNYLDADDDEDGTLTADEIAHAGDEGPCSDCDGDGVPDYLESSRSSVPSDWGFPYYTIDPDGDGMHNQGDNDDDGDGIATYDEDLNDNDDYFDDDADNDGIPAFLDPDDHL